MDIVNCSPLDWYNNEETFTEQLKDENTWNKIPLLNVNELHDLKDLRLVRFRGMIQDMHGPEIFLEKFEVINEETKQTVTKVGKYVDISPIEVNEIFNNEEATVNSERQSYVAVSIPAINHWVYKFEEDKFKISAEQTSHHTSTKRSLDEEMETEETQDQNKKQCTENKSTESSSSISQEYLLNVPIPDPSAKVCHLKVYKNCDSLKLNSVCEFVGFLSVNPSLVQADEEMNDEEFQVHNPPPSLIPRIHCVFFKALKHDNPLLSQDLMLGDKMQYVRKELLILFTQLLFGDELAAEYLILHLLSGVYLRKDYLTLGKFSLNISNIPQGLEYGKALYDFIELLVTKSHYLEMSLENMNQVTFVPKKDYTSNRLTSSILQLSPNTHFVLDETKLSAGKLNEAGVKGVQALSNAIKNQKTMYDFTYYQLEYDCDIAFLILSEGKSMLPSDVHVVLQPDNLHLSTFNEIVPAARHFLKPELMNDIRVYISSARLIEYELTHKVDELVQNDYVEMRQKGNVTGDDLHNLLVLARLVCISLGKASLDEDCWKKARSMEEARKQRLKQ